MKDPLDSQGSSAVAIIVGLIVVAGLAFGGWFVWSNQDSAKDSPKSSTIKTIEKSGGDAAKTTIPDGWMSYKSDSIGLVFAHPAHWQISEPMAIKTTSGEAGLSIDIQPSAPQDGDLKITIGVYPASATIRSVDALPGDTKVDSATTADRTVLDVISSIGTEGATRPDSLYVSSCWPRNCTPQVSDGKFVSIGATGMDSTCDSRCGNSIPLVLSGDSYQAFLKLLETISIK